MEHFQKHKKDVLTKLDKSSKGYIDSKILDLCNKINKRQDMFTLSSCSGRVCLVDIFDKSSKKLSKWHYITHEYAKFQEISDVLNNIEVGNRVNFRQESAIIHICLNDLNLVDKFIIIAKKSGFNRCGAITINNKIVVEIISGNQLNLPIYDKGVLVDNKYLKYLVSIANKNQDKSWQCINKLINEIDNI